ncbi:hypothetical protein DFH09DRAFT_1028693 [Mycena vulgaris]|nr:hypothetical protein DFH09DRAFT_1028693 [Mycena vulgaris]
MSAYLAACAGTIRWNLWRFLRCTSLLQIARRHRGVSLRRRPNHGRIRSSRRAERVDLQTVAALVFATQEVSIVPFYTLHSNAGREFLYVADTTELANVLNNGYHLSTEPVVYICQTQICGSVPFYYLNSTAKKSNFYTAVESERLDFITNEGYTDVYIVGYVLPLWCSQCT